MNNRDTERIYKQPHRDEYYFNSHSLVPKYIVLLAISKMQNGEYDDAHELDLLIEQFYKG